jgi:hypothetical protein
VWETYDLAMACQHAPFHPGPGLNAVHATATTHTLYHFPYRVRYLPGRTLNPSGCPNLRPSRTRRWSLPSKPWCNCAGSPSTSKGPISIW